MIEVGEKFGDWTVIKRQFTKNKHLYCTCKCVCGNVRDVRTDGLTSGRSTSCGCETNKKRSQSLIKDISGQKFGRLTAIEPTGEKNSCGQQYWRCICDCGREKVTLGVSLRNGKVQSCGCLNSKGEERISKYLTSKGIEFKTQIQFKDCLTENKNPMRFDFGIYNNGELIFLLEYQGETHFIAKSTLNSWMTFSKLEVYQNRDKIKKEYCKSKNIPLEEITYKDFYKIEAILSELLKKYEIKEIDDAEM